MQNKVYWRVEWLDREGKGHEVTFYDETEVQPFMDAIADLCCMADVYRVEATEQRGVIKGDCFFCFAGDRVCPMCGSENIDRDNDDEQDDD